MISDELSWSENMNKMVTKAKTMTGWVLSVFNTKDPLIGHQSGPP